MNVLEGVVKYLDCTNHFSRLLLKVNEHQEESSMLESGKLKVPLNFVIDIDFSCLINISDEVAHLLLMEPHACDNLFNKAINLAVEAQDPFQRFGIDHVQTTLHISLPPLLSLLYVSNKTIIPYTGLFVVKGILIAYTIPNKYCKSAVYRCPIEGCPGQKGQRVFGDQVKDRVCISCGCIKEEFLRARVNGDELQAVFIQPEAFQSNLLRHQGVKINLKDGLIEGLSFGDCYNVVASCNSSQFLGWGIEKTTSEHQLRFNKNLPTLEIPKNILLLEEYLNKTCPNSPWALIATLASHLASHLYPLNSFFQLKYGLLLSLASQSSDRAGASFLAVGPDCSALLQAASQLSGRCVSITAPSLCGSITGSEDGPWIEAGPLLQATGGICYLGDWAKFGIGRSSAASQIISALESGRIDLSATNNSIGSPSNLPLRTSIWTIWSRDKATPAAQAQLRTLKEVFGMPFIGDGSADIEAVAEHLLFKAMNQANKTSDSLITTEEIKQYINIACSFKVQLTLEATRLLRNYFVASRRERPDCLPLTAIKTMAALAEAHARLCLRTQVLYEDVILIAYLYEESIAVLYGSSVMSPPITLFGGLSCHLPIGPQVDSKLKQFSVWLEQYIKSLLSDNSVNCSLLPEE